MLPDAATVFAIVADPAGDTTRTRHDLPSPTFSAVMVLPQLGPLYETDTAVKQNYVRQCLDPHRPSRQCRNRLRFLTLSIPGLYSYSRTRRRESIFRDLMANSAGKYAVDGSPNTAIAALSALSKQPQVASPTTASHFQESPSGKCDEPLNDPFTLCLAPAADADPGARFDQPHCHDNMTPRSSTHNLANPPTQKFRPAPGTALPRS